jgi:hypothetical protein
MPECVGCGSGVVKQARFCPRCGRADPSASISGGLLLVFLLLIAAATFAVLAQQLDVV